MNSVKKRVLSLALALVMMLSLLPVTANAAATSLFPDDTNYVELDKAGDFYKKMQNKETFNGVIYLKGCPTTSSLKAKIKEFRERHNDIIYGAEVHSGGYGQLERYLRSVVYNTNELTGERMYPKDINVYIMFRVENGVLVRAKTWDTPKVTIGYVWLGETENMPGEQSPILPKDKLIRNITVSSPTREQIVSMWKKLGLDRPVQGAYEQMPSLTAPYAAGKLASANQTEALNALNFVRYIAGIDYNVTLNDNYIQYSQDAALTMAINRKMTHYPDKPAGMDDALYASAKKGAGEGNIAMGYSTMQDVIINGWMADSDGDNIEKVGHRRWILNPKMGQTGFGRVDRYSAMYSVDRKNTSATYEGVVWPAQNMPMEYFDSDYSWSISFDKALPLPKEDVAINLTRLNDGAEWGFSGHGGLEFYDGVVYPYTTGMGQRNCIVFKPKHINIGLNEVYRVRINDRKGTTYFQYFVTFFSLNNVDASITSDSTLVPAKTPAEFDLGTALKPIKKVDPGSYPKPLPAPEATPAPAVKPAPSVTPVPEVTPTPAVTPAPATTPAPIVTPAPVAYEIALTPLENKTFTPAIVGYAAQTAHSVTIKNTGNKATGTLTAALSGANASSFTLSKRAIGSIAVGGSDSFTVVPKTGLSAGTYTAIVTVKGVDMTPPKFTVSFTVGSSSVNTKKPIITINKQPTVSTTVTQGSISGSLTVSASASKSTALSYQWCKSKTGNHPPLGTKIQGETSIDFAIPKNLTAGTYYYFCVVSAEGAESKRTNIAKIVVKSPALPANSALVTPPANTASTTPSKVVKILEYPTKTAYKVGEGFDATGLNAVIHANGNETNINNKITFYVSKINGVQLTQGRKFTTTGKKVVEIRYEGKKVDTYTINVTK